MGEESDWVALRLRAAEHVGSHFWLPLAACKLGMLARLLQGFIDAVSDGAAVALIGAVYQIDQIVEAQTPMEESRVAGKIVVLT